MVKKSVTKEFSKEQLWSDVCTQIFSRGGGYFGKYVIGGLDKFLSLIFDFKVDEPPVHTSVADCIIMGHSKITN